MSWNVNLDNCKYIREPILEFVLAQSTYIRYVDGTWEECQSMSDPTEVTIETNQEQFEALERIYKEWKGTKR